MEIKPEKQLKTLWIITWLIIFVVGAIISILLFLFAELFIFLMFCPVFLIFMLGFIIWIPKAYRALEYSIDEDGVMMKSGVVWKKFVTVPYLKITNVDITRGPLQRRFGIGTIHVQTAGAGGKQGEKAELKITGVKDLEIIRKNIIREIKQIGPKKDKEPQHLKSEEQVLREILTELKEIKGYLKK